MTMVKLISSDDQEFVIEEKAARKLKILEVLDLVSSDSFDEPIPLKNVNGPILKLIVDWAEHHKDDPDNSFKEAERISQWDDEFLGKLNPQTLLQLIDAADFLQMDDLFKVATMMRDDQNNPIQ